MREKWDRTSDKERKLRFARPGYKYIEPHSKAKWFWWRLNNIIHLNIYNMNFYEIKKSIMNHSIIEFLLIALQSYFVAQ